MDIRGMYASPIPIELYRKGGWLSWLDGIWYFTTIPFACGTVSNRMVDDYWHLKRALRSGRYRVVLSNDMPLDALQLEKCQAMGLVRAGQEAGVETGVSHK